MVIFLGVLGDGDGVRRGGSEFEFDVVLVLQVAGQLAGLLRVLFVVVDYGLEERVLGC